jgi:hypothetical protein
MAAKIIAAIATLLIDGAAIVAVLFMMLIAMNGFNESDAMPGLITYLILSAVISLLMAAAAFFIAGKFINRQVNSIASVVLSILIAGVVSIAGIVVACVAGIGIAEYVRVNY